MLNVYIITKAHYLRGTLYNNCAYQTGLSFFHFQKVFFPLLFWNCICHTRGIFFLMVTYSSVYFAIKIFVVMDRVFGSPV